MNYNQSLEFLNGIKALKQEWDLEDTKRLLEQLDNPHKGLKAIHVAGTNAKGSVSAMIANILIKAGYKVGLYTSPHIRRATERIQINNQEISKDELSKLINTIKPLIDTQSYFEVMTAIAFKYFKDKEVDFVVLETGMGGRLDATNVCESIISVITNVHLEHTNRLGNKIEQIAKEKAGIIKPNTYCVTCAEGIALEVIKKECEEKNTELYIAKPTSLELGVKGEFQKTNAGLAIKTMKRLKHYDINIPKVAIIEGLESVKWSGRFEFMENNVLVDCAHNVHAMSCLANELRELKYNNLIVVLGVLNDKDIKGMVNEILPLTSNIILTKPNNHRAAMPKEVARFIDVNHDVVEDPKAALNKAKAMATENDLIVVTGSIYTVSEVMG